MKLVDINAASGLRLEYTGTHHVIWLVICHRLTQFDRHFQPHTIRRWCLINRDQYHELINISSYGSGLEIKEE